MTEDLIIVGAGGTSRAIAEVVEDLNMVRHQWNMLGFLDDDPAKQAVLVHDHPVLGRVEDAERYRSARFIIGVANYRTPLVRKQISERLAAVSDRFATIVHPTAQVSKRARLQAGTTLLRNVTVAADVTIGRHVVVCEGVAINHEATLADFVTVAPHATITGLVRIAEGAYVGASSAVLSKRTIGEAAVVGIGAVVIGDVPPGVTVLGNPARVWKRGR